MWIRLRQIAIVAADLRSVAGDLGEVLGLEVCHVDPAVATFGLKNSLWPVGSQFLEVVTPTRPDTAAGRYLERRHGDGGYMVIHQVDDIAARRRRVADLGVRIAFDLAAPTRGHDGIQLHPGDTGGSFFEMDEMLESGDEPGGPWYPAGPTWEPFVRTDRVSAITAAELQSDDPDRLATQWSEIAEIPLSTGASGEATIELDNAILRFVEATDGRGEGLGGIDLEVTDRATTLESAAGRGCQTGESEVTIGGLRMHLVEATR